MIATLLGALFDSIVKGAFAFFSAQMEKRGLIQQGREQQHTADLEATVKDSTDAAKIKDHVEALPDSSVDVALEQLRESTASGDK